MSFQEKDSYPLIQTKLYQPDITVLATATILMQELGIQIMNEIVITLPNRVEGRLPE